MLWNDDDDDDDNTLQWWSNGIVLRNVYVVRVFDTRVLLILIRELFNEDKLK